MLYDNCDVRSGGWCFTARSGKPTFVECDWDGTMAMNFWGDSQVTVERCRLRNHQGEAAVNLQNQSEGTLIDCEFDKNAMTAAPDSTGRVEVKYTLTLKVIDGQTGTDVGRCNVVLRPAGDSEEEMAFTREPGTPWKMALTEFVFDTSGKQYRAPYELRIEANGYRPATLTLPMDKQTQETIKLTKESETGK
jgi:hypothetical protein